MEHVFRFAADHSLLVFMMVLLTVMIILAQVIVAAWLLKRATVLEAALLKQMDLILVEHRGALITHAKALGHIAIVGLEVKDEVQHLREEAHTAREKREADGTKPSESGLNLT